MDYPRVVSYAANRGTGHPLLLPDGTLDNAVIEKLARYPVLSLDVQPWFSEFTAARSDIMLHLRRLNPAIKVLAYQLFGWWYLNGTVTVASSDTTWARGTWQRALLQTQGHGAPNGGGVWVRWENPATEAALTKALCNLAAARTFDGLFLDFMGPNSTTIARAMQRCVSAVREAGGEGFIVTGNGDGPPAADGGMREGFPNLLGNDFPHVREWRSGRPHMTWDWVQSSHGYGSHDSQRAARFVLGTACMFDAVASYGTDRTPDTVPYDGTFWLPEYDGGGLGTGWLGEPLEAPLQSRTNEWSRVFAGGMVLVNSGTVAYSTPVPPGLTKIDGTPVSTFTVPPKDAVFLVRVR